MCICINCQFYKNCWVYKGLNKIPKVHTATFLRLNLNNSSKNKTKLIQNKLFLKIFLNMFKKRENYEFDVIECEGFCEKPGQWLN